MTCNKVSTPDYIILLDDPSLSLFEKKGGNAIFRLEEQSLIGIATPETPNTFFTTKEEYSDFILDFSVKVDPRLNSGVQIRSSLVALDEMNETLGGYQVEIDPSLRAWSGGIYEERGRGWIGNLCANQAGREAFRNEEWNQYHIEAVGNSIKVWVNGVNTVNLLDVKSKSGFIGFQVHSIDDESLKGAEVKWKDIKLITKNLDSYLKQNNNLAPEINLIPNHLSQAEKNNKWKLFDRDNIPMQQPEMELKPWSIGKDEFCSGNTTLELLRLESVSGNFEMKFEYKIEKGGKAQFNYGYVGDPYSCMLADDPNLPEKTYGHQKAGSIENFVEATNLSNPDRAKALRGHDQWSQVHVIVKGDNIKHWLNNNLVVDITVAGFHDEKKQRLLEFKSENSKVCLRSIKLLK